MMGIDEIKALLREVKGMRSDHNVRFDALTKEVRKVNDNLEEIERQNKERFDRYHAALKAELEPPQTHPTPRHHR